MDILFKDGLAPDSINVFMTFHPRLTLAKFQRALRRIHRGDDTADFLLPASLLADPLWDWLDSDTVMGLVIAWFSQSSDTGGNHFDWVHEFSAETFSIFLSPPASSSLPASSGTTPPDNPMTTKPLPPNHSPPAGGGTGSQYSPSPSHAYIHSYHDAILLADTTDLARRSDTAPTGALLTAHPLWQSSALKDAINIDKKTFLTTDLPTLSLSTPSAIHDWYRKFTQQATSTQIDLCPLRHFKKGHALWPHNLPIPLVFEMGSLILLKLQSKAALDLSNQVINLLYLEHITYSDSKLAGYYFLHALLAHAADSSTSTLASLPLYSDSADPVSFASALLAYRQGELSKDRQYTSRELSLHFLRELDLHSFPIQVHLKAVEDLAPDCPVPPSLLIPNLALVMAQHPPCNLSLTHTGTFTPLAHRITTPHTSTWQTNASHQRPSSTPNPSHPFHQREDIQCVACGTWGHSASRCSSLAKAALLQT